jgi:hypothetical protein
VARQPGTVGRHRKQGQRESADPPGPASAADRSAPVAPCLPASASDDRVVAVPRLPAQPGRRHWRHRYRGMAPESLNRYTDLESRAEVVRTYEPEVCPALLQVEDYARVILARYCPDASGDEVSRLLEWRMSRQARLRAPRFRLWAVIDETALRGPGIDVQVMRSQLAHLITMTEEPNVTLQLAHRAQPPGLDDHVAIKEPITHFRFPDEHVDDVVFIERPPDGVVLTGRRETGHYSRLMSRRGIRASSAKDVRDHLHKILLEMTRGHLQPRP